MKSARGLASRAKGVVVAPPCGPGAARARKAAQGVLQRRPNVSESVVTLGPRERGTTGPAGVECRVAPSRQACYLLLNPEGEVEHLDNGRVRTKVFIDMYIMDKAYDAINAYYRNNLEIPGFRKGGNVPESVIMSNVGKEQYFLAVLEEVFKSTLEGAFAKLGDRILADTETIETPTDEMVKALVTRTPFNYQVSADILPEVAWKSPYAEMTIKVDSSSFSQPDEEKVEEIIQEFRKEQAQLNIAVGRNVQRGDMCVVEASCVRKDNGKPALAVPEGAFRYDTEVSSLPNFVENLEKLTVGGEAEFDVTMPEDWADESVRGLEVSFKVKVNEIFERKLPDLTDDFASQIIPNCTSMKECREFLLENIAGGKEEAKMQAIQNAVTESISECVDITVPESMVVNIGREEYGKRLMEIQQQGQLSPDMVQKLTSEKLVQDYIEKERDTFEMLARASIGVAEIQKLESLAVSEEQLEDELNSIQKELEAAGENPDAEGIKQMIKERLEAKLVFEWVEKNCQVEYV
ncbi:chloroplast trigger factor [Chloropicon primus]|uniref:peptidylprolyl isomerase n=3 Tax=Chloropicon primus TaxID=1764295 RepID=A0A5B8MNF5_9CHLO|nr:chloroplast trigger factor [Chloropicon primus]UPR00063.1 chloroplast trigger factor [Chloropicon primus]|eukprot:QDZ20850.1 chloroplast trigger factor [Chloropicon primus]